MDLQKANRTTDTSTKEVDGTGREQTTDAIAVLKEAIAKFHPYIALACSFSPEDVVLAHMIMGITPQARIFSIDTGRLNEETYECAEDLTRMLKTRIEWFFPDRNAVEKLECEKGMFSFRQNLENRHECCAIRKVEPLSRALSGLKAWITGLRREQNMTRGELKHVEVDEVHGGIVKVNPLAEWEADRVWDYVRTHKLPYNRLHDKGYPSIGCAPCTRAIQPGEHPRAGRWWWENPEHKECGLHVRTWNI